MKKGLILLLFFATSAFIFYAFKRHDLSDKNFSRVIIPDSLFRSGDIVFRDGRGFLSNAFKKMCLTDRSYSHAGIIHIQDKCTYVLHVIGDRENKSREMRKDMLSDFCSGKISNGYAVYRSDLPGAKIDSIAVVYYNSRLQFDDKFDLSDDDKMYCTELVSKVLCTVSGNKNYLPLTEVAGIKYIACDNIYLSPHLHKLFSQKN
jgi:hypothetical protein